MQKIKTQNTRRTILPLTSRSSETSATTLSSEHTLPTRKENQTVEEYNKKLEAAALGLSIWVKKLDAENQKLKCEVRYLQAELNYDTKNRPL